VQPGVTVAGDTILPADATVEGPVWIGTEVRIGAGVRLTGPVVIGDGATIGDGAQLRSSIIFPGTNVVADLILIDAIAGHSGILQSLRRRG
jgi:NDP-sugar pyrophosphorylase family protein